jgi:hypothetical protein
MLHDPSHYTPVVLAENIRICSSDQSVLRDLAKEKAAVAALPVHQEKIRLWTALNDLKSKRPMVWINEVCWHEMNIDDELTLRCEGSWAREQELNLRREMYQWHHFPGDMVVNPWIECPKAIHSTDFGIIEDTDVVKTDDENEIVSRHFNSQIEALADLEKIKMPRVIHNQKATAFRQQAFNEVFSDILPVKTVGQSHIWFTPWDFLIRWTGIENAMLGLYDEPDLYHAAVDRLVEAWMTELDQLDEQKLLELDNNNTRVGSGGYGYTSELPGKDYNPDHVRPHNMWGCSNAQIFSSVSPDLHWEFAIAHDMRWMERWGLNYYGCCEPLDNKLPLLRRIPNLRKISVSPWCNSQKIIGDIGSDFVLSRKPSPAIFAEDTWHPDRARKQIREFLDLTGGTSHVELIMKDISTVRRQPQRLWEWAQIAMEEAER